jgi:hypothetical protein
VPKNHSDGNQTLSKEGLGDIPVFANLLEAITFL